jgi:hypothetical protein
MKTIQLIAILILATSCGTQDDPTTVNLADLDVQSESALDFESLGLKNNKNKNNNDDKKKAEDDKRKKEAEDKRKKDEDDKRKKEAEDKRKKEDEDKRKKDEDDKRKAKNNNQNQNSGSAAPQSAPIPVPTAATTDKSSLAFSSVVKLDINGSGKNCRGAYAYEDLKNGNAQVYLYTSAHCFEKRNPLGAVRYRAIDSVLTATLPVKPFQGQSTTYFLSVPKREIFQYTDNSKDDAQADIVRIPKETIPLDKAAKNYLPVCSGVTANAFNFHALMLPESSFSVRAIPYSMTEPYVPPSLQKLLNAGSPQPFKIAKGVEARPGDSGSPVFLTNLSASTVAYSCLFGLVTREVWRLENASCSGKSCRMKGEAVFEKIRDAGTNLGRWGSW